MAVSRVYPDTIAAPVEHELVIKKSRFITHISPVASPAEADEFIAGIRTRFWDARHNCIAMVTGTLGDQARSSDDGEPSGTAGMPMLDVLRRRTLTDLVAVVTRYFGGIKLGAGGLVRAYSTAVSETLDTAQLVHRRSLTAMRVEVSHADVGRYEHVLRDWAVHHDAVFGTTAYAARATVEVHTPPEAIADLEAAVAALSQGAASVIAGETNVVDVPAQ